MLHEVEIIRHSDEIPRQRQRAEALLGYRSTDELLLVPLEDEEIMKTVCHACIQHASLREYIRANASHLNCSYCGKSWKRPRALALEDLLRHMRARIELEYEDAANSVGYDSAEGGYLLPTMDGYELLEDVGVGWLDNGTLLDDLAAEFNDTPWVHVDPYSLTEQQARNMSWDEFLRLVKHRVRYLLWSPEHTEDEEITPPAQMLDELGRLLSTHNMLTSLRAGQDLIRVRLHAPGDSPPNTLASLGPPPIECARFANRMSPAGVSMFYVAFDEPTAIAETYVRRDGSPTEATIATFTLVDDVTVLDLTQLPRLPSIFDSDQENEHKEAIGFLHRFAHDLTQPIAKDGREHIEYVPSQVVTEYVRYQLVQRTGRACQGILYPSARREGGIGCVLFYAHEDIVAQSPFGPAVDPPFVLRPERTVTRQIDTGA